MYGYFWVNQTFCSSICNHTQVYSYKGNRCDGFVGENRNVKGKFDYNWTYGYNGTDLLLYVTMGRMEVDGYYYQGGNGYSYRGLSRRGDGSGAANSSQAADYRSYGTIFFDDGNGFYKGYGSSRGYSADYAGASSGSSWSTSTYTGGTYDSSSSSSDSSSSSSSSSSQTTTTTT